MMSMTEQTRGVDRAGRRRKRFLSPSEKYEIWLQLIRQEVTQNEAAAQWQVDRSTIMKIRTVAKEGALAALAASRPGSKGKERDYELEQARAENARLSEALKEMAVRLTLVEGKDRWG
jgi:transposase